MEFPQFDDFSGPDGEPTEAERRLIAASRDGLTASCDGLPDNERSVSSTLIAAIATGRFRHADWHAWSLHDLGLRLSGATIRQRLDLERRTICGALMFHACTFIEPLDFDGAIVDGDLFLNACTVKATCRLVSARIAGQFSGVETTFESPTGDAIQAQGVRADDWFMDGATVSGGFDINSVDIPGRFSANDTRFLNPTADGVQAHTANIGDWFMDGATIKGRFDIDSVDITGRFSANNTRFLNPTGDAVKAHLANVGAWFMNGATVDGRFSIVRAEIAGEFNADRATFDNIDGEAVNADSVKAAGWFMNDSTVRGTFNINSARIDGWFGTRGTFFENPHGVAIQAPHARFSGGFFIERSKSTGCASRVVGGIDLFSAVITKALSIQDTEVSAYHNRAISLRETHVHGETNFRGSTILGHIHANRARFDGRLTFREVKEIVAASIARQRERLPKRSSAAVVEVDHHRQHRFRHHAIVLQEARVEGRLVMPDTMPEGIIDLSRTRCDTLEDALSGWPAPLDRHERLCAERLCVPDDNGPNGKIDHKRQIDIQHLVLDGFEYSHLEYPAGIRTSAADIAKSRSAWLNGQSAGDLRTHFNPQPWRQLAAVLRAMGYDEAARKVAIQRHMYQRQASDTPLFHKFVSRTLHFLADYGFNPWKTVFISIFLAGIFSALFWGGYRACGAFEGPSAGACRDGPAYIRVLHADMERANDGKFIYPTFNSLVYSLDRLLPIPDLGMETYWRPNTEAIWQMEYPMLKIGGQIVLGNDFPLGWLLYLLSMVEAFLGAILVAIAVTGFTGLLTRDEK